MGIEGWLCPVDEAGTWLCEHVPAEGSGPGRATRLRIADAKQEKTPSRHYRARLHCPDCGTLWRVWLEPRRAKRYVTYPRQARASDRVPGGFRPAFCCDIDRIIAQVSAVYPDLVVTQHQYVWPADDDGIWWFGRPGVVEDNIQLESSSGDCPILVEGDEGDAWGEGDRLLGRVAEVVGFLLEYLSAERRGT